MIKKSKTSELVDRPNDRKVEVKWVFRTKTDSYGSISKYKARLIVKVRLKFFELMITQISILDIIRLVLAIAVQNSWKVLQLDVKSAALNDSL